MNDTGVKNESDQTFILVRGVHVPKTQVEQYEAEYEAELVDDAAEWRLVAALDKAYTEHRMAKGVPPERVTIAAIDPFIEFIPHVLQVQEPVTKAMVRVSHKPAWFRRKRPFVITR
jgi:hypothetical protein